MPVVLYLSFSGIFVLGLVVAIFWESESFALASLFVFSLVIRVMYFVSTGFAVFPFGDPYAAYGATLSLDQSSHLAIPLGSRTFNPLGFASLYGQWPALQLVSVQFAKTTGLPLFEADLVISVLMYVGLFVVSYALIKAVLSSLTVLRLPNLPVACMAIVISIPFFQIPPLFKYDLPATVLLLSGCLILVKVLENRGGNGMSVLILLTAGLTITHSYSSLLWLLLLTVLILGKELGNRFEGRLQFLSLYIPRLDGQTSEKIRTAYFVAVALIFAWWTFFSDYIWSAGRSILIDVGLLDSILASLHGISPFASSYATMATPTWLLYALRIRNLLLIASLGAGVFVIFFRPSVVKQGVIVALLISTGIVATVATVSFYGGNTESYVYPMRMLTPLLAVIIVIAIIAIARLNEVVAKGTMAVILVVFMLVVSIGFWGSTYAPAYLYDNSINASSFGEHPVTSSSISQVMSYLYHPQCIVTNEEYVTALSVPLEYWHVISGAWFLNEYSGCIAIVYPEINATSSYITQIPPQYQNFSFTNFYHVLEGSNLVLNVGSGYSNRVAQVYVVS
jgi:hypothetical protein